MNKKLLLSKFGKLFLMIGIVFAISGITNANAQAITVTKHCTEYGEECELEYYGMCVLYKQVCNRYGYYFDMSQIRPYISTPSIPSASQILANMSNVEFKAKIISSIPDKDTQFKAKIMTVLPLNELAEMYDPNKIYQ